MLLAAAGAKWNVNPADLRSTKASSAAASGQQGTLGEFAQAPPLRCRYHRWRG